MAFYDDDDEFGQPKKGQRGTGSAVSRGGGMGSVSTTPLSTPGLQPEGAGITGGGGGPLETSNRPWWERAGGGFGNTGRPQGPLEYTGGGNNGGTWGGGSYPGQEGGSTNTGAGWKPQGGTPGASSNPADFIKSMLGSVPYGANSLKSLKGAFGQQGYNVWTDGNGGARGIITDPFGMDWNVLDRGESMNWWNNQTGSAWDPRIEQRGGGGGGSDSSGLLALITQMLSGMNQPGAQQPPAGPPAAGQALDLSALLPPQQSAPSAAPQPMALQDQGLSRAMEMLAMQMPQLFASGGISDPLVRQLLALQGVR